MDKSKKASKVEQSLEKKYVSIFARDRHRVRKKFHEDYRCSKTISSESSNSEEAKEANSPTPTKKSMKGHQAEAVRKSTAKKSELASFEPNIYV